jgi:negative modulator of initiation of replication
MKTIEIDDDLYQFIAGQTQRIGESASDILRRLLPGAPVKAATARPAVLAEAASIQPAAATLPEPSSKAKAGNIFDLVTPQDLQTEQNMYLLSVLARVHKKDFVKVLEIKGRNRLYFGTSAEALNEAGSSTNPKQIPNTNFWVITNSNTTRKKMMLTETAIKLGYSAEDAERIRDLL